MFLCLLFITVIAADDSLVVVIDDNSTNSTVHPPSFKTMGWLFGTYTVALIVFGSFGCIGLIYNCVRPSWETIYRMDSKLICTKIKLSRNILIYHKNYCDLLTLITKKCGFQWNKSNHVNQAKETLIPET